MHSIMNQDVNTFFALPCFKSRGFSLNNFIKNRKLMQNKKGFELYLHNTSRKMSSLSYINFIYFFYYYFSNKRTLMLVKL